MLLPRFSYTRQLDGNSFQHNNEACCGASRRIAASAHHHHALKAQVSDGASVVQVPPKALEAVLSDHASALDDLKLELPGPDGLPLSLYKVDQAGLLPLDAQAQLFDKSKWRHLSAELPVAGHQQVPHPPHTINFLDTADAPQGVVEGLAGLHALTQDIADGSSRFVLDDTLDLTTTWKELERQRLDSPDMSDAGTTLITDLATVLDIPSPLARSLAAKIPRLLTAPAGATLARFQRYERALMMPLPNVVQLLCSSPNLSNCTPEKLTYAVQGVSEELGVSGYQLQCLLLKNSWLLNLSQVSLAGKLDALSELYGLNREQAIKVALAQPVVLTVSHTALEAKRDCLQRLLGLAPKRLAALVAAEPAYLQKGSAYLATKMFRVAEALQVNQQQLVGLLLKQPNILFRSVTSLGVKLEQLGATFGLPRERVLELVDRHPDLLTRANDTVQVKCANLAQQLDVPLEQVAAMLRRSPTLISLSCTKINNRLVRLSKKLQLPPTKITQLAIATPSLLTTRVHTLQKRWEILKTLGATHRNWAQQLMSYKAATIGPLLHLSDEKLLRLQYLADTQQQHELAISSVASYGEQRFRDKFPGFEEWLREGRGGALHTGRGRGRYKSKHKCGHKGRRALRAARAGKGMKGDQEVAV